MDTVCILTREEYNRTVLQAVDDCVEMPTLPDYLPSDILKNKRYTQEEFPDFNYLFMEENKEVFRAGWRK